MITRSKLVEQLRESQIQSQHKCAALTIFSPKPHLASWADVVVAVLWMLLCSLLLVSSYVSLHLKFFGLFFVIFCVWLLLLVRLRISRQTYSRKRERRLPLSM